MGIENLPAFFFASVVLILSPGIDTIYVVSRSISQGRLVGIISAAGITCGLFIHTAMAAFGLSAIIATSALLYSIVKYAGAAYLIFLGIQAFLSRNSIKLDIEGGTGGKKTKWNVFKKGILTNVLNPKVALFFFSFLPQFVQPGYADPVLPFFLLGGLFAMMGITWCFVLVIFASWISAAVRENDKFQGWLQKASGVVFIGLGLKIAFDEA